MKSPCVSCPFRTDVTPFIHAERAEEIADALFQDSSFVCHKTVDYNAFEDDEVMEFCPTGQESHCAGAMIVLAKMERPNQLMRIAMRLRVLDLDKLALEAPVYEDLTAFVERHREFDP